MPKCFVFLRASSRVRCALKQPDAFEFTILNNLKEFLLSTFQGEHALNKESTRRLLHFIFNAVVEPILNIDRNREIERCKSPKRF